MDYYMASLLFFDELYQSNATNKHLINFDLNKSKPENFKQIMEWSRHLGRNGWVASPFIKVVRGIHPWYWASKRNRHDLILKFFTDNNENIMSNIFGYLLVHYPNDSYAWYVEAVESYKSGNYISCTLILTTLFEQSIRACPLRSWNENVRGFFGQAIQKKLYFKDQTNNDITGKIILKNCIYSMFLPSLSTFMDRFYDNSNYKFEDRIEPPYLNRQWLMHGMMKRDITKGECIQMFNALLTLRFITEYLITDTPYDN